MRQATPSVARWHALEIALESDRDRRSPFRDVDVRIELEAVPVPPPPPWIRLVDLETSAEP